MTRLILIYLLSGTLAACALDWTPEQWRAARIAYNAGQPHGYGYTMIAVCERESFVGSLIIRHNISDGREGSWGFCHMQLTTAMHLEGYSNAWVARAELAPRLMLDDYYAADLAAGYLVGHINRLGWRAGLRRYNGSWTYAREVGDRALELQQCGLFR